MIKGVSEEDLQAGGTPIVAFKKGNRIILK